MIVPWTRWKSDRSSRTGLAVATDEVIENIRWGRDLINEQNDNGVDTRAQQQHPQWDRFSLF